ncbi:DNA cytosine methyltransferase [Pantoea ananatis]
MARIVGEVRPEYVFLENSPLLVGRGLAVVLGDLAKMGFDAEWYCVSASDLGAPHQRDRIWLVAYPAGQHGALTEWHGAEREQAIIGTT